MAKKSKSAKKEKAEERKVQEHLDEIKKDLEELRTKLGMTKRGDLTKLPMEAARKLSDTSTEIIKTASDVFERTLKVAQYAAVGAVEGAKKALHEETKKETKRQKKKKS
ncbi:MAG TPA: hypothetical protein VLB01_00800 [Thermodesulfobacteriota bacterium]|nr:hypothetical protein [Thermodesulfobacteriota bacterium]